MLDAWRHSGFNVFAGERIQPREKKSLENLAAYLIRATFSQKRMDYSPEQATVVYRSKDGKEKKTYDALEWLAAFALPCPGKEKADNPLRWRLRQLGQGQRAQAATSGTDPHCAGAGDLFRGFQAELGAAYPRRSTKFHPWSVLAVRKKCASWLYVQCSIM